MKHFIAQRQKPRTAPEKSWNSPVRKVSTSPRPVAKAAWRTAAKPLRGSGIALEIAVFDRDGNLLARTPFLPVH